MTRTAQRSQGPLLIVLALVALLVAGVAGVVAARIFSPEPAVAPSPTQAAASPSVPAASSAPPSISPSATQPTAAGAVPLGSLPASSPYALGIPYGSAPPGSPVLVIWEDFQCPACGALERANGAEIARRAEAGEYLLVWRPTTFLDANLGNDASTRAAAAWGCAVDAGKTREYHDLLFANQPEAEGLGFTDELLLDLGRQSGLVDAQYETFAACVQAGTYKDWAGRSLGLFMSSGVAGTPHAELDGVEVTQQIFDAESLDALLAGQASASGAPVQEGAEQNQALEYLCTTPADSLPQLARIGKGATPVPDYATQVLQAALNGLGISAGSADGLFGKQTQSAVVAYQQLRGLESDGQVGAQTWSALQADYCG